MDAKTIRMASQALKDKTNKVRDVAKRLGITTATLYTYCNGDGSLKSKGRAIVHPEMVCNSP